MSFYQSCEWADEYPSVVATIGPKYRIIVDRNKFGWTFQCRRSNRGRWFALASVIRHRASFSKIILNLMHGRYVTEHGITQETVDRALEALPETFDEGPTFESLMINAPRPRTTPPTSYKTAHDYQPAQWRDDWGMNGLD